MERLFWKLVILEIRLYRKLEVILYGNKSPDPKMSEVTGILSIAFHGRKSLFNSGW